MGVHIFQKYKGRGGPNISKYMDRGEQKGGVQIYRDSARITVHIHSSLIPLHGKIRTYRFCGPKINFFRVGYIEKLEKCTRGVATLTEISQPTSYFKVGMGGNGFLIESSLCTTRSEVQSPPVYILNLQVSEIYMI